jgi:hypothetical protein
MLSPGDDEEQSLRSNKLPEVGNAEIVAARVRTGQPKLTPKGGFHIICPVSQPEHGGTEIALSDPPVPPKALIKTKNGDLSPAHTPQKVRVVSDLDWWRHSV